MYEESCKNEPVISTIKRTNVTKSSTNSTISSNKTANSTTKLTKSTTKPTNNTTKPAIRNRKPANNTTKPTKNITTNPAVRNLHLSVQQTGSISQMEMEWIEERAAVKDMFEFSLVGVVEAIYEVQTRGDSIMSGMKKQRDILSALKSEIEDVKGRIAGRDSKIKALKERQVALQKETGDAERDTERINKMSIRIKETVRKMEKHKDDCEQSLRRMEGEIEKMVMEMEEKKPQLSRIVLEIVPMAMHLTEAEETLKALNNLASVKSCQVEDISSYLVTSFTQLSHLQARISSLANLPLVPDSSEKEDLSPSPLPLVPILSLSMVLNMVTGAHILSQYRRNKQVPLNGKIRTRQGSENMEYVDEKIMHQIQIQEMDEKINAIVLDIVEQGGVLPQDVNQYL